MAAFDLAFALSDQGCIVRFALDLLQRQEIRPSELVEKAIVFLSEHFDPSLLKPSAIFLVKFFKAYIIIN
jgi:hypothetical protein